MSEDSHSNGSAGSLRGLKGLFGKRERTEASEPLCRYDQNPSKGRKSSVLGGFQTRKEDYTPGIPGLDRFGYEKYNVMESEIYISCPSATSAFDDMEPTLIRATNGNVVGHRDEAKSEAAAPVNRVSQLYDPFESIDTGSSLPKNFGCVHGTVRDGDIVRDNAAPEIPKMEYATEIEEEGFLFKPLVDEPAPVAVDVPMEAPVEEPETIVAPEADPMGVFTEAQDEEWFDAAVETEEITTDIVDAAVESAEAVEEPEAADIVDAPIEAIVAADVAEEFSVEEPVERISAVEAPADAPVEEPVEIPVEEAPVEIPVEEVPAEEPMVVVPVLPEKKFEGLYVEGDSEGKPSVIDSEMINQVSEPEAAPTSAGEAEPESAPAPIAGIDMEGASVLPPMSVNPAKPRVRFRFINGVLTKVIEEEPAESDEGLRGPFDVAAGEAVERIGPARAKPVEKPAEEIYVIDMEDEFDSVPEPEYGEMAYDDALESLTFDAVPPTVIAELIDLMPLSYPELDVEIDWSCPDAADDGLEAACFAEPAVFEVPELPVMIGAASEPLMIGAACDGTLMIGAPDADTPMLGAAESPACIAAPEQAASLAPPMASEAEAIINGVVFSFGSRSGTGSVTFSF